jgi:hypothetical protein
VVDDALAGVRDGFRLLMIGGEPGIGKTTVLQAAIGRARDAGFRVLACRSVQAETRMSFTNLGDLLASVEAIELESLPPPQRHALEVALLRAEPTSVPATQRAIGAALLSLLQALSTQAPSWRTGGARRTPRPSSPSRRLTAARQRSGAASACCGPRATISEPGTTNAPKRLPRRSSPMIRPRACAQRRCTCLPRRGRRTSHTPRVRYLKKLCSTSGTTRRWRLGLRPASG